MTKTKEKPAVPATDLWDELDSVRMQIGAQAPPEDTFSTNEYAHRYGLDSDRARRELELLVGTHKLRRWGKYRGQTYYERA